MPDLSWANGGLWSAHVNVASLYESPEEAHRLPRCARQIFWYHVASSAGDFIASDEDPPRLEPGGYG